MKLNLMKKHGKKFGFKPIEIIEIKTPNFTYEQWNDITTKPSFNASKHSKKDYFRLLQKALGIISKLKNEEIVYSINKTFIMESLDLIINSRNNAILYWINKLISKVKSNIKHDKKIRIEKRNIRWVKTHFKIEFIKCVDCVHYSNTNYYDLTINCNKRFNIGINSGIKPLLVEEVISCQFYRSVQDVFKRVCIEDLFHDDEVIYKKKVDNELWDGETKFTKKELEKIEQLSKEEFIKDFVRTKLNNSEESVQIRKRREEITDIKQFYCKYTVIFRDNSEIVIKIY